MFDLKQLFYLTLCATYCVIQTQAFVATIEIKLDDNQKRSAGGMHDKLIIKVSHEDGTGFETEVQSVPTLAARTARGSVMDKEHENSRTYSNDFNIVLVEVKDGSYITKRAFINYVEYERDSEGKMQYSRAPEHINEEENQLKKKAITNLSRERRQTPNQLYLDIVLVIDYPAYSGFSVGGTEAETIADIRAFFTCVVLAVQLRLKRGAVFTAGQININVNQLFVVTDSANTISTSPKTISNHLNVFSSWVLGNPPGLSYGDHYMLITVDFGSTELFASSDVLVCSINSSSAINMRNKQFNNARFMAHVLGHSLGASDDPNSTDCASTNGFIMSPEQDTDFANYLPGNSWHFSDCSVQEMEPVVNSSGCLRMREVDTELAINIAVKDKDDQCDENLSPSFFCAAEQASNGNFTDLCRSMLCSNFGSCGTLTEIVPAEYTMCTDPANPLFGCIRGVCRFRYRKCFEESYAANCSIPGHDEAAVRICRRNQRRHCRSLNFLRPQRIAASAQTVTNSP